ncbi:MAG: pyrimidine reductase family protein [Jatrophihabitans sp.]|uniref:pyrimidine reductase family protein n=1 Tax=Jatrophihabitans sp. TaxID=1932789 RepID=UPI003F8087BD
MRRLLPPPADDVDLHAFYAHEWVERGGVRMNFVASVDGAGSVEGASRGLQTPGDNAVFAALRDLADVVVAGAGTIRAERYGPARFSDRRRAARREYGLPDELPIAAVSSSLDLDPSTPLFRESRPIVITSGAADAGKRRALAEVADVLVCGDDAVDLRAAVAALRERGLTRVLGEGGPRLFTDFVRAGVADELCLSITPLLAGPGNHQLVGGDPLPQPAGLELTGLLEEDGALFTRYRVLR